MPVTGASRLRVICRIRPVLATEVESPSQLSANATTVSVHHAGQTSTTFPLDAVYTASATNTTLFNSEVLPLISRVTDGQIVTVFTYGMSGSGKSHTMNGRRNGVNRDDANGITQETVRHILNVAKQLHATVNISFIELYNEKLYCLLATKQTEQKVANDTAGSAHNTNHRRTMSSASSFAVSSTSSQSTHSKTLHLQCDANGHDRLVGAESVRIDTIETFNAHFQRANKNKHISQTGMNAQSSRSHTLITINFKYKRQSEPATAVSAGRIPTSTTTGITAISMINGTIHLCDLAGNEDNKLTNNVGARMSESCRINASLHSLSGVIHSLNAGVKPVYRNSQLTRLLKDGLGGRGHALMILCVAPTAKYTHMTVRTLAFAVQGRTVINQVESDVKPAVAVADITPPLACPTGTSNTPVASAAARSKHRSILSVLKGESSRPARVVVEKSKQKRKRVHIDDGDDDPTDETDDSPTRNTLVRPSSPPMITSLNTSLSSIAQDRRHLSWSDSEVSVITVHADDVSMENDTSREEESDASLSGDSDYESDDGDAPLTWNKKRTNKGARGRGTAREERVPLVDAPQSRQPLAGLTVNTQHNETAIFRSQNVTAGEQVNVGGAKRIPINAQVNSHDDITANKRQKTIRPGMNNQLDYSEQPNAPGQTSSPPLDVNGQMKALVSARDVLVDVINNGSMKQLMSLQTIGKKRAQLIISARRDDGGKTFATLADLNLIGMSNKLIDDFARRNLVHEMWSSTIMSA